MLSRVIGDDKAKEVEEILYQKYNQPDDSTPKATPVIVFKQKDYKDHMLLIKNSLQRNESLLHKLRSGGLKSQELTEMEYAQMQVQNVKSSVQIYYEFHVFSSKKNTISMFIVFVFVFQQRRRSQNGREESGAPGDQEAKFA